MLADILVDKKIRAIIFMTIGVILLAIAYWVFTLYQFRIISTTPDTNNYPDSLGTLKINFNKSLDAEAMKQAIQSNPASIVKFNFDGYNAVSVQDKVLTITIGQTPRIGSYTLELNNIRSKDGSTFHATIPFIVKKINYNNMDEATKELFDKQSNDGETLPDDPIVKVLPYQTDNYLMSYTFQEESVELPATITITMKFFPPDGASPNAQQVQQEYLQKLRDNRTAALQYLKDHGIDINKYVLKYTEYDLRDEFPAGYVAQPYSGD